MNRRKIFSLALFLIILFANMAFAGALTSITVTPSNNAAGAPTIYTFDFTTSATGNGVDVGIPVDGKIVIVFPSGFDLTSAELAQSTNLAVLDGGLTTAVSGDTIFVSRDGTGTAIGANTAVGLKVAVVGNNQTAAATYQTQMETRLADDTQIDSGTSASFIITHGSLATFNFSAIANQTAGTGFAVSITAVDNYGNTVETFNSQASLSDVTGSLSPTTTTNFASGIWSGTVVINQSYSNDEITATYQNIAGTSNNFDVSAGTLDHFVFQTISSPKTAGTAFSITITAEDAQGNQVTTFTDAVNLSDSSGTISPAATGNFTAGQWTGNVSVTQARNDEAIIAGYGAISSLSNLFNIQAAALADFAISTIANQTAGTPFSIQITAQDQYGNTVENFSETVDISDLTGTASPAVSGNFSQGVWTGDVTISTVQSADKISVVRTSTQVESGQSNAFNVQPGSLDHFSFNSVSSPQAAGSGFSITITAMDANNNTVTSFSGTASLSDLTGTINPGVTGNFSGGVWTGTVTITQSQTSDRITATSGSKTGTSNNFDVNSAALDYFEISSIGTPQTAGTPFSITIRARDIYGNLVDSYTTPVNLFDNTGTISPVATGNFSSGVWTGNVTITKSQNDVRITASGGGKQGVSNYFNVVPAPLERFSISTIGTQAAGESFTITVTALDFYSNRVTDFTGTVDITDLTGTISPTVSGSFDQGQWSGAVTITQVKTSDRITVTRTSGAQTGSSNLFDVVAGNVDHFQISTISSPQTAGTPFSVTITAQDANNQTVTNFTGTVNLYDLTGSLSPTVTGNFSNGAWTGNLTITESFSGDKVSVSGAGKSGESNAFNVQSAGIDHFTFGNISSPQTAGQSFSVSIEARDVYENVVASFTSTAILSDLTGTISPTATGSFSSGTWTGNVTVTQSQVDNQISATRSGTSGTSNNFTVSPAALHHFEIAAISTQTTNEPFSITVTAQDQFNNTATQFTGKVTISDLTGTVSPGLSGSFSQGLWSGNVTVSQSYTNDKIHVVRQGGSEEGNSNDFDVASLNVDHFSISAISDQTAGASFSITIRAEDASNNLVPGFSGTVSLSDLSGTISPVNSGNFSGGTWTGNIAITKSYSADKVTATDGSHVGMSNSFDVNPAALDHFIFQNISSPQTAGTPFSVTITAKDAFENTVTGHSAPVSLSDNTGTISPVATTNFTSGVWTGNVSITKSQTDVRITATYSGKVGQSNYFNVDPGALANFDVSNLGTQEAGVPFLLTVTALDAQANVVDNFSGTVDFSDLTGTIEPPVSSGFVNGSWSGNVLVRQATSNDVITATRTSGAESGQSNAFDVISSQVDTFVVSTILSPQTAGNQFTITITAKDADLNTVTSFSGTANLSDLSGTISPQTTGNFTSGVWTGQVSITETYSMNQIFVNALGESGVSNYFDVDPNVLDHFELQSINSPQTAGTAFSITITARDAYENKITSFANAANLSDNTGTLTPATTGNFSSGSWTGNVTITKAQNDLRITAAYSGKQGVSNYFNVNPGALANFDLDPVSTQQAGKSFLITATARDNYSNVATQFTGTVDISDKSGTIEPQISSSFISGVWSGTVMIRQANSNDVITVTRTNGTETGLSNGFDVISSHVDTFVVSAISSPKTAGAPFSITISAKDADLNTVTGFTGVANLSDLSGTISPQSTGNFVNGVWTGQVTITGYQISDRITVTALGESGQSNSFDVNPNSLDHFELSEIGSPQVAGAAFSLTISAKDIYGNTILSFASTVNLSDSTGTLSPATTTNFTNGVWTGNLTITKKKNDVRVTATGSGKQGVSNFFNVQSGALDHFAIGSIDDQFAGVPFLLSVSAKDSYDNVVDAFSGTVDISDLSGSISPTRSGSFQNGLWSGNVVVSQAQNNNQISVLKTNGTESGLSNIFDVEAGTIDHFEFSVIGTSQTAGVPISVTISAIDGTGNLVPGFSGTVSLTDLTGTITPTTTTAFSNGIWSGTVKITKTYSYDRIFASGSGKSGESNLFNVLPGELDHFALSEIFSPQIAGQPFSLTIAAKDSMENTVTSFFSTVSLADNTGSISPSATTNFTNGEWTGQITITKKKQNVYIRASQLGKIGQSNYFNVNAAQVSYLKIMDAAGGTGQEIGATSLTSKDKLTLYAAGFDSYDNYSRDVFATWGATGTLDPISPNTGTSVVFEPKTPQTEGKIYADSSGVTADSTGTITVGSVAYVKIRTAPDGGGIELSDLTITSDEQIQLYSAGYDNGDNFVGNIPVQWASTGNLTPAVSGSGTAVVFQPTLAPASGQIIADHASATDDTTGLISVIPGAPVGVISLTASPSVLPADGVSTSAIESNNILDSDGNRIAAGTQFTVNTTMGSIISTDVNPSLTGKQVAANDSGKIDFVFQVSDTGGTAFISVSSVTGSASGYTSVLMNSLQISKVSSSVATVSQGQSAAPVAMLVENLGPKTITGLTAGLIFTGPDPGHENRNSDFPQIVRTDGITSIPSLSSRTLTFEVDVSEQAHTDSVTIDGWISGQLDGVAVTDTFAITKGKWSVQTPADVKITRVYSVLDTVSQGGRGIGVKFYVSNTGEAGAEVSLDTLGFWSVAEAADVTSEYEILPAPTNPTFLPGNSVNNAFDFTVNVGSAATLGSVVINGKVLAADQNSAKQTNDFSADTTHTWYVKSAPIVGIKGFYPSQNLVTKNQTVPWNLTMIVENNGETNVRLENNSISFFLKGADVSSEYQVTVPNKFKNSGSNILSGNSADTLIYTVTKTGSSTGEITIRGRIYLRDLGTGNEIVDESLTGVSVLKSAELNVKGIIVSQNSVTKKQTQDWMVDVALENKGGTDIVIDTLASRSFLRFGAATDFQVRQPTAFKDGDLTLEAGKIDTLRFIVDKTTASPGNYFINAHFSGYQVTSGDSIYSDSQDSTLIVVENPAKIRIQSLQNLAENSPHVNTGQNFRLRIKLQNLGQDEIKQAQVHLTTNGSSSITQSTLTLTDIPGFSSKSDTFFITAANTPVSGEKFLVAVTQAEAENTAEALGVEFSAALDSTEIVNIQQPANLTVLNITAPDTVRASQSDVWAIKVAVKNSGGADLILASPEASDIVFSVGGDQKSDYIVQPPTALAGGGLALSGGNTDTLIYLVNHTGEDAGAGEILAQIDGTDENSGQVLSAQKSRNYYVRSTAAVQLVRTLPICPNYNVQLDRGVVDRGQNFSVRVWVRNLGRKKVKNVQVQLTTDGGSIIAEPIREIASIEHSTLDSLDFQITANPNNPVDYEFFTSKIISAKEYDTNLPAAIDNSGDDRALIAVTDSAKLSISAHTEKDFSVYTINQIFTLHGEVENAGAPPALVDSSGTMMVLVPQNYRIIVGEDTVQNNNVVAFYPGSSFDWHILTPEIASGPDTIIVSLLNAPLDLNLLEQAQVAKAKDTVVVSTVATNILDSTFVADPPGARDGILSTQQEFTVESDIQFSPNIEQVWATLSLAAVDNNYHFQTPADSTQQVASLVPARWKIIAPELEDEHEQLLLITIRANEVGNPVPLIYKDTVRVRSVLRAELKLSAIISYPEGAKDGQVTTGQRYEIKAEVKNSGAGVYGDAFLFINLGSTGSNFSDTTETAIKPFKIDSAVTWSLRASEQPVSESFLQIGYAQNGVPKDENTNARAYYHPNEDRVNISITTVPGGNVDLTAKIQGPAGAVDGILSTEQRLTILAQIHSTGVRDVESELVLPGDFSFAPNVSPVQAGESSAQWEIVAPADSVSGAELKIVSRGIDVNNDTVFVYSDTARIDVDVVKKGLVEVVADIKSPPEATDRIVSVNQDFVVEGYLINHGQAASQGNYQLEIILPSGYTTEDSLAKTISGIAHAEWTVRAPDHELSAANIEVRVPPGIGPVDENSGKEMDFWNANRSTSFAVTTYEKSVEVTVLPNQAPNTIVAGQSEISMLGLRIFNGSQDVMSNAVVFSGLELIVSDRFGKPISDPGKVISRVLVRSYSDENLIFADVTDMVSSSLLRIDFSHPDTIQANEQDSIDVLVTAAGTPEVDNFKIAVPADTSMRILEAMTGNIPSITGISGSGKYFVESDFVVIRGNSLKEVFGNYPNPFGSKDRPKTTITYYLKEDTKVDIKIYTLIGELVWARSFSADDPQSKKGMHDGDVVWDAKNDKGKKVLNGIYVIYLKAGYGETATTKAAVVK